MNIEVQKDPKHDPQWSTCGSQWFPGPKIFPIQILFWRSESIESVRRKRAKKYCEGVMAQRHHLSPLSAARVMGWIEVGCFTQKMKVLNLEWFWPLAMFLRRIFFLRLHIRSSIKFDAAWACPNISKPKRATLKKFPTRHRSCVRDGRLRRRWPDAVAGEELRIFGEDFGMAYGNLKVETIVRLI